MASQLIYTETEAKLLKLELSSTEAVKHMLVALQTRALEKTHMLCCRNLEYF